MSFQEVFCVWCKYGLNCKENPRLRFEECPKQLLAEAAASFPTCPAYCCDKGTHYPESCLKCMHYNDGVTVTPFGSCPVSLWVVKNLRGGGAGPKPLVSGIICEWCYVRTNRAAVSDIATKKVRRLENSVPEYFCDECFTWLFNAPEKWAETPFSVEEIELASEKKGSEEKSSSAMEEVTD
jgi:hypothetical protein